MLVTRITPKDDVALCCIHWLYGHLMIIQPASLFLRDFTSYYICLTNPEMLIFTAIIFVYMQPSCFPSQSKIDHVGDAHREQKYHGSNNWWITVISREFECSHLLGTHMHSINNHIMQECMKLGILRGLSSAVQVNT